SMPGLVAELRRTVADPHASRGLREAAARRLAWLAVQSGGPEGTSPLAPRADPSCWWGMRARSAATRPLRDPGEPVHVSDSLLEGIEACPRRWFLEREAGGRRPSAQGASLGSLVHVLADSAANGELGLEALMAWVDRVWEGLEFPTPWSRVGEYDRIRLALDRFLRWQQQNPRRLLDTESRFTTLVELDDGERVRLGGYADRLELDSDGRV